MRVISQNGKYDVPYDNFVFVSEQNMIYAVSIAGSGTKQWLMAEYTGPVSYTHLTLPTIRLV